MGGIGFFNLLSLGLAATSTLASAAAPPLRFSAVGFTPAQESLIQEALAVTRQKTESCALLKDLFPWLQTNLLEVMDSGDLQIELAIGARTEKTPRDECANSAPSYFTPTKKMTLQTRAFSENCYGLDRVLLHELIHMSWTFAASPRAWGWASEGVVSSIEAGCTNDGVLENRRSHYH